MGWSLRQTMYLALKPLLTGVNASLIYWWTGSAAATAVTGPVAFFALPLTFHINNTLWDWYDRYRVRKGSRQAVRRMGAIGIVLTFALLTASVAAAQPVATSTQAEPQREATASLGHSFAKAVTQKTMTFIIGIGIYSAGAGGLGAGTALSAINTGFNFVVLTLNDYAWDVYWPNTNVSANTESFRAVSSLSRNTAKYLTFKPIVTAVNLATVYWWTGSVMVTAVTGTAASLVLPLTFYANNTLWDWYDWYTIRR